MKTVREPLIACFTPTFAGQVLSTSNLLTKSAGTGYEMPTKEGRPDSVTGLFSTRRCNTYDRL